MFRRRLVVLTAILAMLLAGVRLRASKPEADQLLLREGEAWSSEDTLLARIPDPQTGSALTPTTRGVFRYRVEKVLEDGSAVLSARVVSLHGGSSRARLAPLQVDHPPKPDQYLLMTAEGRVYGPFAAERRDDLLASRGADAALSRRPTPPWILYKLPLAPLDVGETAPRTLGAEKWTITRLEDEEVGGSACAVYEARFVSGPVRVVETTWFQRGARVIRKREISERRARDVTSTLTQVRL